MDAMWVAVSAMVIAIVGSMTTIIMYRMKANDDARARAEDRAAAAEMKSAAEKAVVVAEKNTIMLERVHASTNSNYSEVLAQLKTANEQVGKMSQVEVQLADVQKTLADRLPPLEHLSNATQLATMLEEFKKVVTDNSPKRR